MLVFMMCICSRYANQTTSLRVGVELDIPRSLFKTLDGVMTFVTKMSLLKFVVIDEMEAAFHDPLA